MAAQDDDRFKSEGKLTYKIEKFSKFARGPAGVDLYSEPTFIQGIQWKINAEKTSDKSEYMAVYLYCPPGNQKDSSWSCEASFTLQILPQKPATETEHVAIEYHRNVFCAKYRYWQSQQYIKFEELLHPGNGWYDAKADTITIEAYIKAKMPCGFGFDLSEQWYRVAKNYMVKLIEIGENPEFCTLQFFDGISMKEYKAPKEALVAHSDVFRAMFTSEETKECRESRAVIEDSSHGAIYQMLHYIHTGRLSAEFKEEEEDATEGGIDGALLDIADKYNIEPLAVHSEEKLLKSLCVGNVCACLVLADRHNAHSLRIACGEMIRGNLCKVRDQEEWAALKDASPKLLVNILEKLEKADFK